MMAVRYSAWLTLTGKVGIDAEFNKIVSLRRQRQSGPSVYIHSAQNGFVFLSAESEAPGEFFF